ncbi:hypothetical protein PMAYCL1PPCAC_16225, partial [Pristionchus mayeri]
CANGIQNECISDLNECVEGVNGKAACVNQATCTNTIGSYKCNCVFGTYGQDCTDNPDDCAGNATVDGVLYPNECIARDKDAECFDGFGTYTCTCSQWWKGEHCLTDVNECERDPPICENFGTCVNLPGSYKCLCIEGTEGDNCEINPDDCLNGTHVTDACNSLDPKAKCVDGYASFSCACGPGYTLQFCDLEIIIYNVLQLIGGTGSDEGELIAMLRDLLKNPSMMKDLVPFMIGLQSRENRTRMSWEVEDMFLWVAYEERTLDLKTDLVGWNDVVLGNCFTFNHLNNTERWYRERASGAEGGLKAAVKLNTAEFVPWTETSSIMTFIHPNTELIFSESSRYNTAPSTMTTIQSKETRFERLGGRFGKCAKSTEEVASYYYDGSYTTDVSFTDATAGRSWVNGGCLRSCYQDEVQKECNCMDSRYPMPADSAPCQLPDRKCVESITAKGDVSTWAGCKCPLPCENSQFDSSYTVAPFVRGRYKCNSYTTKQRLNDSSCGDGDGEVDYAIINVQVPRLMVDIFEEIPAWTFNRILGNVGGLGGIVCGINLITFFEFFYFFFIQLPLTLIYNRYF